MPVLERNCACDNSRQSVAGGHPGRVAGKVDKPRELVQWTLLRLTSGENDGRAVVEHFYVRGAFFGGVEFKCDMSCVIRDVWTNGQL